MPVKRRKGITGKLDKLVGSHVRSCRQCEGKAFDAWLVRTYPKRQKVGCKGQLEWAHFKSRKYLSMRWDIQNGFCLCNAHHRYLDTNMDEWTLYLMEEHPERISYIWEHFSPRTEKMTDKKREQLFEQLQEELKVL